MMTFVVFEADGVVPENFPPRHAFVHGPDALPVQADLSIGNGVIFCAFTAPHSTALVVQFEVGPVSDEPDATGLGLLTLPTCLLPSRGKDNPYLLSMELARHQIMLVLNKMEDWQLTELSADEPVMRQFERARSQFTKALSAQREESSNGQPSIGGYSPDADRLAARTIALAVDAGEQLAVIEATRNLRLRGDGSAHAEASEHYTRITREKLPPQTAVVVPGSVRAVLPGTAMIGCAISPATWSEALQRVAHATCDFISMPMRWRDLEPREGKYNFAPTDRWIEWAVRTAKIPVFAGPLLDFRQACVPDWLYIWENDYETLRDLVVEHVQAVVTRYRRTVQRWTVCSGLNVNTNIKVSFDQIVDLTRLCVQIVKKLQPTAKVQVEITQPWGEYHAWNKRSLPPVLYADAIVQTGLPIDAISLRVSMGHAEPGLTTRDMLSYSTILDRFAAFERPIAVVLGAPSSPIPASAYVPRAGAPSEDPHEPGRWRGSWTEARQASWLSHAMSIAASKPYVHNVCWHELADGIGGASAAPEMPFGGLVGSNGQLKASATRLGLVRDAVRKGVMPVLGE